MRAVAPSDSPAESGYLARTGSLIMHEPRLASRAISGVRSSGLIGPRVLGELPSASAGIGLPVDVTRGPLMVGSNDVRAAVPQDLNDVPDTVVAVDHERVLLGS